VLLSVYLVNVSAEHHGQVLLHKNGEGAKLLKTNTSGWQMQQIRSCKVHWVLSDGWYLCGG